MIYQFMNGVDHKKIKWYGKMPPITEEVNTEHLDRFFHIMYERQEIWHKRHILKKPSPWTKDKFLRDYKFTNVYRELDRASQWLILNVLTDTSLSEEDIIWKIISFRFFNQPDTFDKGGVELQNYQDFDEEKLWEQVVTWREKGNNPWHVAYMMNMAFLKKPKDWKGRGLFKDEAYIKHAYPKYHAAVPNLVKVIKSAEKPQEIISELEKLPAVSGFQSHEFFIDFCYIGKYWKKDLMPQFDQDSYTNVGPGASLGIRLIFPSLTPKNQKSGIYTLRDIAGSMLPKDFKYLKYIGKTDDKLEYAYTDVPNITLHQIEMWLCEYSKYWKMLIGEGKQRSKFRPKTQI